MFPYLWFSGYLIVADFTTAIDKDVFILFLINHNELSTLNPGGLVIPHQVYVAQRLSRPADPHADHRV